MGNEQPNQINVWLQRQISNFRKLHPDAELNKDYMLVTEKNNSLLWEDFIAAKTLSDLAERHPFLKTSVWDLGLPETYKESLYKLYIDTVADLMQFSIKELEHFSKTLDFDVKEIKDYLISNNYRLSLKGIGTRKLSYLKIARGYKGGYESNALKVFENPSLLTEFNIDRPSLNAAWIDEYYKRYLEVKDESLLLNELKYTKLRIRHDGNHLGPYHNFFIAMTHFRDAYLSYSIPYELEKEMRLLHVPRHAKDLKLLTNDQLLSMKKESVRAAISIYRRLSFIDDYSTGDFLDAEDDIKLGICERIHDDKLQLLSILYIEIGIDFEHLLIDLKEKKKRDKDTERRALYGIINPWVREQIETYRKVHKDSDIRSAYEKAVIERPDLVWILFLREQAVHYACQKHPYLLNYVEDTNLNDSIKNILNENEILQVSDIMQHSKNEYYDMFGDDIASVYSIEELLMRYGLSLDSGSVVTSQDLLPF